MTELIHAFINFMQDYPFLWPLKGTSVRSSILLMWLTVHTAVLHLFFHAPGNIILFFFASSQTRARYNRWICRVWSHLLLAYMVKRPRLIMYGDRLSTKDTYLLLSNHQVDTDWIWAWMVAHRVGRHGNMIILLKYAAKFIPFFGTAMMLFGYAFMTREWAKDKRSIKVTLGHLLTEEDPFLVLIFPEGTRLRRAALEQSRDFAISKGMYAPTRCILPRYKGLNATMDILANSFTHTADLTIRYEIEIPHATLGELAKGLGPDVIHIHVGISPISDIPHTNEQEMIDHWYKIWEKKDKLLQQFDKEKKFPGERYEVSPQRETIWVNFFVAFTGIICVYLIVTYIWFFAITSVIVNALIFSIVKIPDE